MTVRVGMIGVGGVAQTHLKNIVELESAELIAVCDLSETALSAAVTTFGASGYTDYRRMLAAESLDAVYIAVPPFAHGEMEDEVSARGIHLLVEKPVELNLEAARRKYEKIRKSGIIHASGYCLRYIDFMEEIKAYLSDKKIGMALAYRLGSTPDTPWFRVKSKSGGQLVEMATHQVDLLRYLMGDITEVYSKMKLRHLDYLENYDIYDVGTTTFEFESGAIGNIVTGTSQPHGGRNSVEIMGDDFRVIIMGNKATIIEKGVTVTELHNKTNMYLEEDRRFIEAIRSGNQSLILADYGEGLKTLEVTLAANESAETGRPVHISSDVEIQ